MGKAAEFDPRFYRRAVRILIASLVMGAGLYAVAAIFAPVLSLPYWRYLGLLGLIVVSAVLYFGLGQLIGALRLAEFKSALKRGKT